MVIFPVRYVNDDQAGYVKNDLQSQDYDPMPPVTYLAKQSTNLASRRKTDVYVREIIPRWSKISSCFW